MDSAIESWLILWRLLEQSTVAMHKLLHAFDSPQHALQASLQQWQQAGVSERWQQAYQHWCQGHKQQIISDVERASQFLVQQQAWLLTLDDPRYPPLLREIADPPPVLFGWGEQSQLVWPQIAMVGTRRPSKSGLTTAAEFAAALAQQGVAVTSGLAVGIDGMAHRAVLEVNGITLAVLGTGLAQLYPKQHYALAQDIIAKDGVVLTEFLPFTPPLNYYFPRRNRIISGLSLGVLVVEAALDSGSLITARLALEQNREVWAIPSSIYNPQAKGCHALIREGARLVDEPAHILADIAARVGQMQRGSGQSTMMAKAEVLPISEQAEHLMACFAWQIRTFDWLVDQSGLMAADVASLLTELELAGRIVLVAGGYEPVV